MITVPTVLVLGAGASLDYGFPLGRELIRLILSLTIVNDKPFEDGLYARYFQDMPPMPTPIPHPMSDIWEALSISGTSVWLFQNALIAANPPSIDAFLEDRLDDYFTSIGKAAIAKALIPSEDVSKLDWQPQEGLYDYLWDRLRAKVTKFNENKLSVITFNYDRSLEYFLFRRLKHTYNLDDNDAADLLNSIEIVHMYGKLGEPSFWAGKEGRDYSTDDSPLEIEKCMKGIKVIGERSTDTGEFQRAHELLGQAERACFLGFSYDETNVERLGINQFNIPIFGTAVGMGASEIMEARERLRCPNALQQIVLRRFNVLDALKNFPVLLGYTADYDESLVDKQLHDLG